MNASRSGHVTPARGEMHGGILRSLHNRNYRLLAAGQAISQTGTCMQQVAQDWLVLQLTHNSGSALGIVTALQFSPLLVSTWGGLLADRYPKRRILILTQSVMGALALALGVLALTHRAAIWQVYLLAFALGVVTSVDWPTRQAFLAEIVGRDGMLNALALQSAVANLAMVVGPAVVGLVIAAAGTSAAFMVNAASYGAALLSLRRMRAVELSPASRAPRARGQVREALSYARTRPGLWMPMALVLFVSLFGMNFQMADSLMAGQVFHIRAGEFGLAAAIYASGAFGGAMLAARRRRPTTALLVSAALVLSALKVLDGLMPGFGSFLVMLVPTGFTLLTFTTAASATIQLGTSEQMRGRVTGLYLMIFVGAGPLGSPLAGWVAGEFGARASMTSCGMLSAVAVAVFAVMFARRGHAVVRGFARPAWLPGAPA
jgi:MFS family permease